MEKEQEKARYPRALDDAFFYMFAGYVSKFGKDKIGMRDTITQILIDLGLDPSSPVDRKWASNKFRIANPNNYDPDDKASHRCKQEYYDYYTIQSTIAASNFLEAEKWDHNRSDATLRRLIKTLELEIARADWSAVPANVIMGLLLQTIELKMTSGNRKLEIASLTLKVQSELGEKEGRSNAIFRTGEEEEDDEEEKPSQP